jgi:Fe2+ transport system protein FeoA
MPKKLESTKSFMIAKNSRSHRGRRWRHRERCHGEPMRQACCAYGLRDEAPLSRVPVGNEVEVTQLLGDEAFRGRIMALGIVPGAALSVLSGGSGRPLVLAVSGSRFLLDARSSQSILVRNHEPRAYTKAACNGGGMEA